MSETLGNLISKWSSLGVGFNTVPYEGSDVDLERLLLDTARHAPEMARLFIMAATWLHAYGDTIAKHRLKRLIESELESEVQPILGLLLDSAQQGTHPQEFKSVLKHLQPEASPKPLFESARQSEKLSEIARRRASTLSQKWGLWMQAAEFKDDAIRPASWIMTRNPALRTRADFRGDLRASIMASLRHDTDAGASESRLAGFAGGSRSQIRNAIENLRLTGRVVVRRAEGSNRREIALGDAA